MKILVSVFIALAITPSIKSQPFWSPPSPITSGNFEDSSPAFATTAGYFGYEEWLAFARHSPLNNLSEICVIRGNSIDGLWGDSVYSIIQDSLGTDDEPTLARILLSYNDSRMMVLWHRKERTDNIWYSYDSAGIWSRPLPLTNDSLTNRKPHVAPGDSGFGAVFERNGRVAFSEFINGTWSSLTYITPDSDTLNSSPQLDYINFTGQSGHSAMAIWEKVKPEDTSHAVFYSVRTDTSWSFPDTITATGDNRHPRFFKPNFFSEFAISWESNRSGRWEIYASSGFGWPISWQSRDEMFATDVASEKTEASFIVWPIITTTRMPAQFFPYFTAGAWLVKGSVTDSISLSGYPETKFSVGTANRHPDISCGSQSPYGLRVWVAWEATDSGVTKLYTTSEIVVVGVEDKSPFLREFKLMQNYPNPFNPTTRIEYTINSRTFVTLKVYNILGQEVATILNTIKDPGRYEVTFDGGKLSNGIYVYRLQSEQGVLMRKMALIK